MATTVSQNCSAVQDWETLFASVVDFWGLQIQICYQNIQGSQGSCVATKFRQNS